MKNRIVTALLGALLLACPSLAQTKGTTAGPAAAPSPTTEKNGPLVSTLTLEEFQRRVQALGFQCERGSTDGKPDDYFTFRAEG